MGHVSNSQVFLKKWQNHLQEEHNSMDVGWRGLELPSGDARSSRSFVAGLERRGIAIHYEYLYGQNTPVPLDESGFSEDHELAHLGRRPINPGLPQVVYGLGNCFMQTTASTRSASRCWKPIVSPKNGSGRRTGWMKFGFRASSTWKVSAPVA